VHPDPSPEHDPPQSEDDSERLAALDGIAERPLEEQVELYQHLHHELQRALGEIDTA
jgi:hypothetical protein